MVVKVIDGWNPYLGAIMHETKALMVTIGSHSSKVIFNVISSPMNLIIIRLSWFILHNPWVDWKTRSFHFESVNETTPKYEAFPKSTLDSKHNSTWEDTSRINQCMQKIKREGDIKGNQGSKNFKQWDQEHSCKQQRREMHFLCMPFQPLILGRNNIRSLFNTKITKMFLKRKM